MRLSGSPTQLNEEDRSWRVRSKRVFDGVVVTDDLSQSKRCHHSSYKSQTHRHRLERRSVGFHPIPNWLSSQRRSRRRGRSPPCCRLQNAQEQTLEFLQQLQKLDP